MKLRLPGPTERHAIVGSTGSGKTVFGAWCLAQRDYDVRPWIIIDFKGEEIFRDIPAIREIDVDDRIPRHKGLYIVHPSVDDVHAGRVSDLLYRVWQRGKTGIFIDEGYMIPRNDKGLQTVLTQGRSLKVPMINLSQRPAYISPFMLSESEFKSIFYLEHPADIERVNEWMPPCDPSSLPDHWSYWYQRQGRIFQTLKPCPGPQEVLDIFDRRRVRRWFL